MARESLMDDTGWHGFDECTNYEACNLDAYNKGRADAIDDALNYCNQSNDEGEECCSCCLSIWKNGKFEGCYLEKLKEQK